MIYVIALATVCGIWLNPLRLRQADLWDHVNYGRVTLMAGELPDVEPLFPLAEKSDFINPAWGGQVLMALVVDRPSLGLPAVQLIHALLVLAAIGVIGLTVGLRTGSVLFSICAACCFLYVGWQQFLAVRPQTIGTCFFCGLLAVLVLKLDRLRWVQAVVVLCFAVWANLHGSFTLGLFAIGVTGIGRACDFCLVARRFAKSRSGSRHNMAVADSRFWLLSVFSRSGFNRLLGLGLCCVVATWVNPYGVFLYEEVFRIGGHPNMASMIEWRPLSLSMKQGQAAAWAIGLLLVAMMFSQRRFQTGNVLLVFLLGVLTLWSSRMINWWAPVLACQIGIHGASAANRLRSCFHLTKLASPQSFRRFAAPELAAVVFAMAAIVGTSPWFRQQDLSESVEPDTPIDLGVFLNSKQAASGSGLPGPMEATEANNLFSNIIFCPAEWTGYLMSETRRIPVPDHASRKAAFPLKVMVGTHVHVIPPQVWNDFLSVHEGRQNCLQILNKYRINVVVLDRKRHGKLWKAIKDSRNFHQIFSSKRCLLLVRTTALPAA